jgi:hypothetical protein
MPNYHHHAVSVLAQVLRGNFLLLYLYLVLGTEEYYTWISPSCSGSASSGSSYLFSGIFMADEVVGVGDMFQ